MLRAVRVVEAIQSCIVKTWFTGIGAVSRSDEGTDGRLADSMLKLQSSPDVLILPVSVILSVLRGWPCGVFQSSEFDLNLHHSETCPLPVFGELEALALGIISRCRNQTKL